MSKRERVFVVDKAGNKIGEKWRDELLDSDCWRVVSIWIKDQDGNVLLQQRSKHKKIGPGIWSAAAEGTIEEDDPVIETALRELEEELGLRVKPTDLKPTKSIHYKDPAFGWRIKFGFLLTIAHVPEDEIIIQEEEVAQVKWFTLSEFQLFVKNNPDKFVLDQEYRGLNFY